MDGTDVLSLELLGPVRARRAGAEVDLGSAHRRAVLAVLAMSANRAVSRTELIDAVWGDSPPASASGSIYTYISGLRRALEPERSTRTGTRVLTSEGSGYSLRLAPDAVDVHLFDAHRDRAQRCWSERDFPGALDALDSALRLWHGEALSGIPGPFAEAQRARLGELRLAMVERRAEVLLASGDHGDLVAELTALVREHPLREALRGLLMTALYRSGRQPEALAVFRDAQQTLIEQSGTEPGAALRTLHERILAEDPALTQAPEEHRLAPSAEPRKPKRPDIFVGRDAEAALLRNAVARVAAGSGGAVWIEGEPGIGKSTLLAAALTADVIPPAEAKLNTVWGAGDELDQRFPLHVMADCLGADMRSADPDVAGVDRVLALVTELCAEAPLILVIDDLQWADDASLLAWRHLRRATRNLPLLLVAACRPVPQRAGLERLRAELGKDEVLSLGPLPDEAVRELVAELVGAPPGRGLRVLAGHSAGNPLYIRETVETLVTGNMVVVDGALAELDASSCRTIPAPLASSITHHLTFLSAPAREFLRWAALLGREFTLADAAMALGKPASDLFEVMEEALTADILVDSGDSLTFRHPLIRRVLFEKTPAAVRIALHRQLAEALAAAGAPAQRVAEQLAAAPLPVDSWVTEWLLANIGVVASAAPRVAVDLLRHAVGQGSVTGEARETFTATLARLLFWMGREPEAEARYVVARTADSHHAAEMRWILAYVHYRREEVEQAFSEVHLALRDERIPDLWRARHEALLTKLQQAESAFEETPGLHLLDGADDASAILRASRQLAATEAFPGEVHIAGAVHYFWAGRWNEALAELNTVLQDGAESASYLLRSPGYAPLVHGVAALIAGHRGEPDEARTHLQHSWAQTDGYLLAATALLAEQEGRHSDALDALVPILRMPGALLDKWLPDLVRLAVLVGDRDQAKITLRTGESCADHVLARCRGLLDGDPDPVLTAASHYQSTGRRLEHASALEDAAVLLAGRNRMDEARAAFRTSLVAYTDLGAAWDVQRAESRMRPFGVRRANSVDQQPAEPERAAAHG